MKQGALIWKRDVSYGRFGDADETDDVHLMCHFNVAVSLENTSLTDVNCLDLLGFPPKSKSN